MLTFECMYPNISTYIIMDMHDYTSFAQSSNTFCTSIQVLQSSNFCTKMCKFCSMAGVYNLLKEMLKMPAACTD